MLHNLLAVMQMPMHARLADMLLAMTRLQFRPSLHAKLTVCIALSAVVNTAAALRSEMTFAHGMAWDEEVCVCSKPVMFGSSSGRSIDSLMNIRALDMLKHH